MLMPCSAQIEVTDCSPYLNFKVKRLLISIDLKLLIKQTKTKFIMIFILQNYHFQTQQLADDLPMDAVEEVGAVGQEMVEEFKDENFGLVGRFFRTLSDYTPGF